MIGPNIMVAIEKEKLDRNVLDSMDFICQKSRGRQLNIDKTSEVAAILQKLENYFGGINEIQVLIICSLVNISFSHLEISVSKYFDMSEMKYLQHNDEIENLNVRSLLGVDVTPAGHTYIIKENVVQSILRNQSLKQDKEKYDSVIFVRKISDILKNRRDYSAGSRMFNCIELEDSFEKEKFISESGRI